MNHDDTTAAGNAGHGGPTGAARKRSLDVVVGTLALLITLPVMLVTALLVLLCDGRPIFFRQERVGRRGEPFTILKFRTMVGGAERMLSELESRNERQGPLFKMTQDPRVTRLGRFLRDSSVDELPQLFNVLRGDMSLVGPRPALAHESAAFGAEHAEARLRVRPGITGLWQVRSRDDADFQAYERLDRQYVETLTLRLDLAILLLTIPAVVFGGMRRLNRGSRTAGDITVPSRSTPWQETAWYGRELLDAQPLPAIAGAQQDL